MRVEEGIGHFLFHCQYEKDLSAKTLRAYAGDLKQFRLFLSEHGTGDLVQNVDKSVIRAFLKALHKRYGPRSIKRKVASLKAFLNYLEYEDKIAANPFRKMRLALDKAKPLPKTLSIENVEAILRTAYAERDRLRGETLALMEAVRNVAVIELLFATGMRVGELCSLEYRHVDLGAGSLLVQGKGRKERRIPICQGAALNALRDYRDAFSGRAGPDGAFFVNRYGRRVTDQSIRLMVAHLARSAGVSEHVTPHMFRHTLATLLLENGVDIRFIQFLLGHSSISVTEIYARVNEKAQREVLEKRHPRGEIMDN
jgi:integrase/recombinase XerD